MSDLLNTIDEALEDLKKGKVVIVVDDEDRENEGDFLAAAEAVSPEMINFMATHGRGLICMPLTEERCEELQLFPMVGNNTDPMGTAFTVSIDLIGNGNTTGISAQDRSRTIEAVVNQDTAPDTLARPGHVFPLKAKPGGVLRRPGHTEAAVDLAKMSGFAPAGIIVEIMNEDGSMARLPELMEVAKKHDLKIISIENLIAHRLEKESLIEKESVETIEADGEVFQLITYKTTTSTNKHIALVKGNISAQKPTLVRVHSTLITGIPFESARSATGWQLYKAMDLVATEECGVVVFMNPTTNDELKVNALAEDGLDALENKSNSKVKMDPLDYGLGAQILRDLGVEKMKLMSNSPKKRTGIIGYGLEVVEVVPF